jgi:hypothetical protein
MLFRSKCNTLPWPAHHRNTRARAVTSKHCRGPQGAETLAAMVRCGAGSIAVLAGGGVTAGGVGALLAASGVTEVHSSCKRCDGVTWLGGARAGGPAHAPPSHSARLPARSLGVAAPRPAQVAGGALTCACGVLGSLLRRRRESGMQYRRPGMSLVAAKPPSDWEWGVADAAAVRELLTELLLSSQHQCISRGAAQAACR